jgi:Ca2+/Na+ antiporter
VYGLRVNVYCTTATGRQHKCSYKIYHSCYIPNLITFFFFFVTLITSVEEWKFCSFAIVPFFFFGYVLLRIPNLCLYKKRRKAKGHFKSKLPESVSTSRTPFSTSEKKPTPFLFPCFWIGSVTFRFSYRHPPQPPEFCGTQLPAKDNFTWMDTL